MYWHIALGVFNPRVKCPVPKKTGTFTGNLGTIPLLNGKPVCVCNTGKAVSQLKKINPMLHYRFNLPSPCSATLAQMPLNEVVLHAEFSAGPSRLFESFYANPTKEGLCAILKAANKKGLNSAVREEIHRRIANFV